MTADIIRKEAPGARWFDYIELNSESTSLSFRNNRIHSVNESESSGCGVRVNIGGRTGFSYTNDTSDLARTVRAAADHVPFGEEEGFLLPGPVSAFKEPYREGIGRFDLKEQLSLGEEAVSRIVSALPHVNVDAGIRRSVSRTRLVNSEGLDAACRNSFFSAHVSSSLVQEDGSRIEVADSLTALEPEPFLHLCDRVIDKTRKALTVRKPGSGGMAVILTPEAVRALIGIVLSGLSARSVWKKVSPFAEKMEKRIFSGGLTILDDPTLEDSPFSQPFDDEGVPCARKTVVERGTIRCFVSDLKHAEKLGLAPTGNASRGYSSLPGISFSNIVIENGVTPLADLMKITGQCLLVEDFIGLGQSNTMTGDFSASLSLAYLVEQGEITGRVKDCMIADNLFKLLADEILFSREREKHGSSVTPYLYFPRVHYTE